jgi:hypothetical protein
MAGDCSGVPCAARWASVCVYLSSRRSLLLDHIPNAPSYNGIERRSALAQPPLWLSRPEPSPATPAVLPALRGSPPEGACLLSSQELFGGLKRLQEWSKERGASFRDLHCEFTRVCAQALGVIGGEMAAMAKAQSHAVSLYSRYPAIQARGRQERDSGGG